MIGATAINRLFTTMLFLLGLCAGLLDAISINEKTPMSVMAEANMTVPEVIRFWGYPVEEHKVVTDDDYILTVHRIPHGRNNQKSSGKRPVIFLQHGLICSSSVWVLNLPHQSAGFYFADQGFDVWMGNFRGNSYSNKRLKNDSREESNYWKFSWEEMSKYDLPAMINHALKKSGQPSLYYVGHSQGTLTMLAKLSKDQAFSKKIRKFFLLAPVSRLARVKGVFHLMGEIYENYKLYLDLFGDSESLANNALLTSLMKSSCDSSKGLVNCQSLLFAVGGPNSHQFNNSRIGIYLAHNPSGTSVRNMVHFSQMVHSKKMASFDEGPQENLELYGQIEPPEYDLSKVHGDLYLFYSEYDWIASPADAEGYLIPTLPKNCVKLARNLKEFNHHDFLLGLRARAEIYEPIADIVRKDFHGNGR